MENRRQKKAFLRAKAEKEANGKLTEKSSSPSEPGEQRGRKERRTSQITFPNLGAKKSKKHLVALRHGGGDDSDSSLSDVELGSDFGPEATEDEVDPDAEDSEDTEDNERSEAEFERRRPPAAKFSRTNNAKRPSVAQLLSQASKKTKPAK